MAWEGGITYGSQSPLLFIPGTITVANHVDDVLQPTLLPYLEDRPVVFFSARQRTFQ